MLQKLRSRNGANGRPANGSCWISATIDKLLRSTAQVRMRKLESQGPGGVERCRVPEAETNAGARHADIGDVPLIFEVAHASAWAAI